MSDALEYRPNTFLSSSKHFHPTLKCPTHGLSVCSLRAPTGGAFWACPECTVTFNYEGTRIYGDPAVVARASKTRGRAISTRTRLRSQLIANGWSDEDADHDLNTYGVRAIQELLAA